MAKSVNGRKKPAKRVNRALVQTMLFTIAGIVLVRFLSLGLYPLFDNTEGRYALIGEVMYMTGNWITPQLNPGVHFWAKPPLSSWAVALSYALFGINDFAARFSSFLFLLGAGSLTFFLGLVSRGKEFALIATCIFASTALAFYLAGGVMTDPALLLGVTLTMVGFWRCMTGFGGWSWGSLMFFGGLVISLLAKGPIGVVLPGLSIGAWVAWHVKWRDTWRNLPWITGTVFVLVLSLPWYVMAEKATPGFINYFIVGEHFSRYLVAGWSGDMYGGPKQLPYGTIWVCFFLAALPWSLLVVVAPFNRRMRNIFFNRRFIADEWLSYLLFWSLAPLIFFTVPRILLITYVATSLPAFALLTAHNLQRLQMDRRPYLLAGAAAIVPIIVLLFFIGGQNVPAFAAQMPTEAKIIASYEQQKKSAGYNLTYVFTRPFSAEFYSKRRVGLARTAEDVRRVLQQGPDPFFAIARDRYMELPADLRERLEIVADHNATLLLRRK
ncbi:MAG: glycosyltransferase family 39 protein [Pseudolabrys sp.]|nr:glycosyltransferase family 39 protein [Pseudolabrys sp.]MBV9954506.1 glycosyltransferase family 39 protein [Pseudolabrys sp.]